MGLVDKCLQFLRCAEAAAGSKETRHMVAEGTIIRMLLDSHDLNGIITVLCNARQHIVLELCICSYFLCILTHADVALVDEQRILLGLEARFFPHIGHGRIPHLGREDFCIVVLHHATTPGRYPLAFASIPFHLHLIELPMLEVFVAQAQLPVASAFNALATVVLIFLPVVEIANEIDIGRIGSPFTEHPSTAQLMKSEIEMTGSKVRKFLLAVLRQLVQFP